MMTDDELKKIKNRYAHYKNVDKKTAVGHIKQLLDEVDRLSGELEKANTRIFEMRLDKYLADD